MSGGYKQVELIVLHGENAGRSEEEADEIVRRIVAYAKRLGLSEPYVEDYSG